MASGPLHWTLEPESLGRFLELLDDDPVAAGHQYEVLRGRLIRLFEWRGCDDAAVLADRTIDRVIRKIDQGADVPSEKVGGYAVGVARHLYLEYLREIRRQRPRDADAERPPFVRGRYSTTDARLRRLESCLTELPDEERELILDYHAPRDDRISHRRRLAAELETTPGALRVRVHRIRQRIERLLQEPDAGSSSPAGAGR